MAKEERSAAMENHLRCQFLIRILTVESTAGTLSVPEITPLVTYVLAVARLEK